MPEFSVPAYWDRRYRDGRSSGAGSEGEEGRYKAEYISKFCAENDVKSVIDWGVGDGQVLELIRFPRDTTYIGLDVSPTIIKRVREKFTSPYEFTTVDAYVQTIDELKKRVQATTPHKIEGHAMQYQLALSLDVLFHFPDDDDYARYLSNLFSSSYQYVVIYATNYAGGRTSRHVMRREFTRDVSLLHPEWELTIIESPLRDGLASFFVYEKVT